jgi:hypothetical protein
MTKHFILITGLAMLWSVPFLGHAPAAKAGDATCCGNAGCESCRDCCPHCGCKLVPVCHISCTTKKETTYKYTCRCETICVPGVTRCCDKRGDCKGDCRCRVHEVKHLVKIPCDKEVPVKKCTVEWVCPHCDRHGNSAEQAAPTSAPVSPSAPMPPAPPVAGKSAANSLPAGSAGATITSGLRS